MTTTNAARRKGRVMEQDETRYFLATDEARAACDELFQLRKEAERKIKAWLKKVGAGGRYMCAGGTIMSVEFSAAPDKTLWAQSEKHRGFYYPKRSTRAGKDLSDEMRSLGMPGPDWIATKLGFKSAIRRNKLYIGVGVEMIGDRCVISAHPEQVPDPTPAGCRPIKVSSYYKWRGE